MRALFYILASLSVIFFYPASYAQGDQTKASDTVPISYFHDLIIVPIFVDGTGPHPFILDTGSTRTVLFQNISSELGIQQNGTATANVHGINSSEIRPELEVTKFAVGEFDLGAVHPVDGPAWNFTGSPVGIIGMDLMKTTGIIIEREDKTITFSTPDAFETLIAPSWETVKLLSNPFNRKDPKDLVFVNLNVDRTTRIPAIFDTGSQDTLMNRSAAKAFFKGRRISNGQRTWTHRGAITSTYIDNIVRVPRLKMGRSKWTKTDVWVKDMSSLEAVNKRRRPMMIVGMDLLRNRDFAMNFPENRLHIDGPNDIGASHTDGYSLASNSYGLP